MGNPLQNIIGKFQGMFKGAPGTSVVGIDIGSSAIKVVQLKKKGGKALLETYGAISLGPYAGTDLGTVTNLSAEKISSALKDLLKESTVTTTDAALSIPSSASLIFMVDIPPQVEEKDYPSIIPIEARKYIPVPISEVSLDWWAVPKREDIEGGGDGKNQVLVVAIQNDIITKYREVAKSADINSTFYEIEVFSAIRANFGHELSSVLLFDMGASKTKLTIMDYGVVRTFHTVSRGSQDISNSISASLSIPFASAEQMKRDFGLAGGSDPKLPELIRLSTDFIFSEANSVVLNYEKKYNKTISKVILSGGGVLMKGFLDLAKANFKSEVVEGNPFDKVVAPAFLEPVLASAGPEFGVALGLALRKLES